MAVPTRKIFESGNLFNFRSSSNIYGKYMNIYGALVTDTLQFVSHFIDVEEGETYLFKSHGGYGFRFLTAFNSSDVAIDSAGVTSAGTQYVCPVGVSKIKLSTYQGYGELMVVSTISDIYTKYLNRLPPEWTHGFEPTRFNGMSVVTYGDSITAQESWQPLLVRAMGVTNTTAGLGGSPIADVGAVAAMCESVRIDALPIADMIMVMGGANDWMQNVPIGTISDTSPSASFYGGLHEMLSKLIAKYHDKRIVLITPIWGQKITFSPWPNAYTNSNGNTILDFRTAMINIAKLFSINLIDAGSLCGINKINYAKYLKNDGAYVHPNGTGGLKLASAIINGLYLMKDTMNPLPLE